MQGEIAAFVPSDSIAGSILKNTIFRRKYIQYFAKNI
nr:MAG TPA: hypothetical protein [Caudoviricetes sp.]